MFSKTSFPNEYYYNIVFSFLYTYFDQNIKDDKIGYRLFKKKKKK